MRDHPREADSEGVATAFRNGGDSMQDDAKVRVYCDICNHSEECDLTPLAGGGWDDRNVDDGLESDGWEIADGHHKCPSCCESK